MNSKTTLKLNKTLPWLIGMFAMFFASVPIHSHAQTYCTPSVTNQFNYNIGMQNVTIGNINNSTTTNYLAPYNDYSATLFTAHKPGASVSYSITLGSGNSTNFIVWVDWNKDGTFAAAENVASNVGGTTTAGTAITGSFSIPSTQAPGAYKMRVVGDLGGQSVSPCTIGYAGEAEDYTMVVLNSTNGIDAAAISATPTAFVVGNNTIGLTWYNLSSTTITSADLGYKLDNNTAVTETFSGSVATAGRATHTFSTLANVSAGSHVLKVWVRNPNNTYPDQMVSNDTITISFCTALSGTYTIDKNSSASNNFKSFTDAVNKLNSCGVGGPIVINVAAGTYTEQVSLENVSGVSATNTITFDGGSGNASTRILEFAATSSTSAYTFRIYNTQYVRIKNLTILGRGSSYGNPIHLYGNASNAIIKGNTLTYIGNGLTANTTNAYRGIFINNTTNITSGSDCGGSATTNANVEIDSNIIIGGATGISWFANSSSINAKITRNRIIDAYDVAIQLSSIPGYIIHDNYMNMRTTGSGSSRGIGHCNGSNGGSGAIPYDIQRNIILNAGNRGMYLQTINNSPRSKIINNLIGGGWRSTSGYGIQMQYERNFDIYHNTILVDNNVGSSFIGIAMGANYTGNDVRNNNIAFTHSSNQGILIDAPGPQTLSQMDYNNLYKANPNSTDLVRINGITYTTSTLKGAQGYNNVFYSKDPGVVSNQDLHYDPTVPALYGDPTVGIPIDVDKDPRCGDAPTIGGDESKYPFPKPTAGFTQPDTVYVNTGADFLNNVARTAPYRHRWYVDGKLVATTHDINYKFPATGNYTVAVVSFACGAKDSFTKVITVVSPTKAPVADFTVDRNVIPKGEFVNFKDLSSNGPSSWTWEITPKEVYDPTMGMMVPAYYYTNGTDSSSQNPVVGFDFAGSYSICLTASNSIGSSAICKSRYVRVKEDIEICNVSETVSNKNFGVITDNGGATGNYSSNMNCNFLISPCSPSLGLKIKSFNLAAGDFLHLYDGTDNKATKLYDTKAFPNGLTGNAATIPGFPDTIMSKSGKIYIEFISNNVTVAPGFEMEWFADSFNTTPPVADFFIPDTVCFGLDVPFMNKSKGFGNMYFWDVDGDSIADYTVENPVDYFVNTGAHQIMLIVENCGGRDTMVKNIFVVNPTTAPRPEFTVDITGPNAVTDVVKFTDHSFRCVDSWRWEFSPADVTFVNGTSASSQNPEVTFGSAGCYDVKLVAGFNGVEDSITKKCFINAVKFCTPVVSTLTSDIGISSVTIGNMSNGSSSADVAYTDYSATKQVTLQKRVPVSFSIKRQTSFNAMSVAIWIDMNQNGTFESSERVAFENALKGTTWNSSFTIPGTAKTGGTRLRIGTNLTNLANLPCGTNRNGEFEDYRVFITEDNVAPVITMKGMDTVRIEQGTPYIDSGAVAIDDLDGDITSKIVVTNPVNVQLLGVYRITYNVSDSAGNKAAEVSRIVIVTPDTTAPVITLTGGDTVYVEVGTGTYAEPGYTAIDPGSNMDITTDVIISGSVDVTKVGTYFITYAVQDEAGNPATKLRTVIVRDTVKPVITLKGSDTVYHQIYTSYIDSGVTYTDNYWNTLALTVSSNVDTSKLGVYTIVYSVRDSSGNVATASRTVIVVDTEKPVITLNGPDTLQVEVFTPYFELGATVADNFSQNLRVVITGTVDVTKLGFYPITYAAVDENGNVADSVTRIVHVVDTKAPVITLIGKDIVVLRTGDAYTDSGYTVTDNYWAASGIKVDTLGDFTGTDSVGVFFIQYMATDSSGNVALSAKRFIYVGINSVEEITALQGSVNIFPNPAANGTFSIDVNLERAENAKVSIFNMLGQEIRTLHNGNLSSQRFNVEMSEKAGMYLVRIQTANGAITKPVILTK